MKRYTPHMPNQNQDDYEESNSFVQEFKEESTISPQPIYKEIWATYFDINGSQYKMYKNCVPKSDEVVLSGITQGVPVNQVDVEEIRQAHRNRNLAARRAFMDFRRRLQSFMCLNVFYIIVLIITINSSFSDFRNYKNICDNFSKASLGFSLLNIVTIVISLLGVFAAAKKSEKLLKLYNGGVVAIMLATVLVAAYGLLKKDEAEECDGSPPKNISLVVNALFTLIILSLFSYSATKLKASLIQLNAQNTNLNLPNIPANGGNNGNGGIGGNNNNAVILMNLNNNNQFQQAHAPQNVYRV